MAKVYQNRYSFAISTCKSSEDKYCEQRALGKKKRAAYRLAYPEDTLSPDKTIDSAASRLEARAEIQARITEWILIHKTRTSAFASSPTSPVPLKRSYSK